MTLLSIKLLYCLSPQSPLDVDFLELVETSEDTSTSNTTEDVGTSSLHHGHESFVLEDVDCAVHGALVFDSLARGHHHTTTNGVNGVGHEASSDSDSPTKQEREEHRCVFSQQDGLDGVVETEVHATVDEDTDARNDETTVQPSDTVGLDSLGIDVDHSAVLTLAVLGLGIVCQPNLKKNVLTFIPSSKTEEKLPGTAVVKGVDESQ